jgi:ABC-type glutathione transport system ATPase component
MSSAPGTMPALLTVESLEMRYRPRNPGPSGSAVTALDGVSFAVAAGTTLALVGASGSGKSTLAQCLACLARPTAGTIQLAGLEITALSERELRAVRPQIQLVFQDPSASLNPRLTALEIVIEPLEVQRRFSAAERAERARGLFERVGLSVRLAPRPVGEFSGGQRQRLAIARALALEPRLLILDEALSALDASVQAQIANLLLDLQQTSGLTYVFITHDLAMAARVADDVAVLERGRIVERGPVNQMMRRPAHAATLALFAATPRFVGPPGLQADE